MFDKLGFFQKIIDEADGNFIISHDDNIICKSEFSPKGEDLEIKNHDSFSGRNTCVQHFLHNIVSAKLKIIHQVNAVGLTITKVTLFFEWKLYTWDTFKRFVKVTGYFSSFTRDPVNFFQLDVRNVVRLSL